METIDLDAEGAAKWNLMETRMANVSRRVESLKAQLAQAKAEMWELHQLYDSFTKQYAPQFADSANGDA